MGHSFAFTRLTMRLQDLKLKYYDMMIQYALQHDAYLDVAKYYYKVWETPSIKEDVADKGRAVRTVPLLPYFKPLKLCSGSRAYCLLHRPSTTQQRTVRHAASPLCRSCPHQAGVAIVCFFFFSTTRRILTVAQ